MQKKTCLQIQIVDKAHKAVAGVTLYSRNWLCTHRANAGNREGCSLLRPTSRALCPQHNKRGSIVLNAHLCLVLCISRSPEVRWADAKYWNGKGKEPGLKGAWVCKGRRVGSYLPINQDINLNYGHLKKTEVHAKEYSVTQGSLWSHLFLWQAAEIAGTEEVPSS